MVLVSGKENEKLIRKRANLAEMTNISLPVPQLLLPKHVTNTIWSEKILKVWKTTATRAKGLENRRQRFGHQIISLVSVLRAKICMPGMMDTILNLSLNNGPRADKICK